MPQLAMYRDGTVRERSNGQCEFVSRGAITGSKVECGVVLVGLAPGVQLADVLDFLTATPARVFDHGTFVRLEVSPGGEQVAIVRAFEDSRIAFAELNWSDIRFRDPHSQLPLPPPR